MKKLQRYGWEKYEPNVFDTQDDGEYVRYAHVSALEAKHEKLLTDLENLAARWVSDEAESKGWFQSHNGNSCAEQLRALLNHEQEKQP